MRAEAATSEIGGSNVQLTGGSALHHFVGGRLRVQGIDLDDVPARRATGVEIPMHRRAAASSVNPWPTRVRTRSTHRAPEGNRT